MQRSILTTLLLSAFLLATTPATPAQAASTVQVTLPQFVVTLNGTAIDNDNRQYPLLVYNNITYFPMTYFDCRLLGLETNWSKDKGLRIEKSTLTGAYHAQTSPQKNSPVATATVATGAITVNGKAINNSKEPYPLLSYRSVTYFPLTWRFAVQEFGWQYQFDNKTGLTIQADNAKTTSVILSDTDDNNYTFAFTTDCTQLYYQNKQNAICVRPLSALQDETQQRIIYQLPEAAGACRLTEKQGRVYLQYQLDGKTTTIHLQTAKAVPTSPIESENTVTVADMQYYTCDKLSDGTTDHDRHNCCLYVRNLSTGKTYYIGYINEFSVTDGTGWFAATPNGVYYPSLGLQFWNQYSGQTTAINPGAQLRKLSSQNGYVIAHFTDTPQNPYRLLVFAPSGNTMRQVFSSADYSDDAVINANGLLTYRLRYTQQLVTVQLP